MPRKIVLTTDHEIFGNGSGDVRAHIVEPTEAMCRIAERHGVPITVFFELEEYLAFERYAEELRVELGYDPAELMRVQAADLARRGHDLQLHLHPQWYGATRSNGRWNLDMETLTVDALFDTQEETDRYIVERQRKLQELSGEPVTVYRAGGFAAQPGQKLLKALARAGFLVESSVVKGLRSESAPPLDFRDTPGGTMWRIGADVCKEEANGALWEIPVYSVMRRRIHQLTPQRVMAKFSKKVPKEQQKAMVGQLGVGRNPLKIARFLAQPVPIKLDYHNLSPQALMKMIRSAPAPARAEDDVLILIGHSKEHRSDEQFETFCRLVAEDPEVEAVSLGAIARELGSAVQPALNGSGKEHREPRKMAG